MHRAKLLLLAFFLLLTLATYLSAAVSAASTDRFIFLPFIVNEREYIIECLDSEGNLIPCPVEEN